MTSDSKKTIKSLLGQTSHEMCDSNFLLFAPLLLIVACTQTGRPLQYDSDNYCNIIIVVRYTRDKGHARGFM